MSGPSEEGGALLRRLWFGSVYEIADIELQRRTWLTPPTTSPHWSYIEFCCQYPQRDQLEFGLNRGHLSKAEFDLLATLGKAISEHEPPRGDPYDYAAILGDPAWLAVVAKADKARRELLHIVRNPHERSYLMGEQAAS